MSPIEMVEAALKAWDCKLEMDETRDAYTAVLPDGYRVIGLDGFLVNVDQSEATLVASAFLGMVLATIAARSMISKPT